MSDIKEGSPAPQFKGMNQDGEEIALDDFSGKNVVLYFYPKDDTPGCTKEACSLRDKISALKSKNAVIIGVSTDSIDSHKRFVDKFNLPFHLIADTNKEIITTYGTWGEKSMYGRKYEGILRHTFVIDPDGIIKRIFTKVKPASHAEQVLSVL